jgi:hypothetical protein
MAATLTGFTGTFKITLSIVAEKSLDLSTPKDTLSYSYSSTYAYGAGALQCDCLWHDSRTLALSTSENLDLAGSLTDAFGDTVTFANIKILIIENTSTAGQGTLHVGGAAATQFDTWLGDASDEVVIIAGESKVLISRVDADGYVATGGADDLLKVDNQDGVNSATYKIIVAGDSA